MCATGIQINHLTKAPRDQNNRTLDPGARIRILDGICTTELKGRRVKSCTEGFLPPSSKREQKQGNRKQAKIRMSKILGSDRMWVRTTFPSVIVV